jgi:hypothetical protein
MARTPPEQSIDAMIEAYVDWREESGGVRSAYDRWSAASPQQALLSFAAYQAALDREAQAAVRYAALSKRVADRTGREARSRRRRLGRRWAR